MDTWIWFTVVNVWTIGKIKTTWWFCEASRLEQHKRVSAPPKSYKSMYSFGLLLETFVLQRRLTFQFSFKLQILEADKYYLDSITHLHNSLTVRQLMANSWPLFSSHLEENLLSPPSLHHHTCSTSSLAAAWTSGYRVRYKTHLMLFSSDTWKATLLILNICST